LDVCIGELHARGETLPLQALASEDRHRDADILNVSARALCGTDYLLLLLIRESPNLLPQPLTPANAQPRNSGH